MTEDHLKNRLGRFVVSRAAFENPVHGLEELAGMFNGLLIVETQIDEISDFIRYTAYGPQFKELEDGESIPWYEVTCHAIEGRFSHAIWKRVDDEHVNLSREDLLQEIAELKEQLRVTTQDKAELLRAGHELERKLEERNKERGQGLDINWAEYGAWDYERRQKLERKLEERQWVGGFCPDCEGREKEMARKDEIIQNQLEALGRMKPVYDLHEQDRKMRSPYPREVDTLQYKLNAAGAEIESRDQHILKMDEMYAAKERQIMELEREIKRLRELVRKTQSEVSVKAARIEQKDKELTQLRADLAGAQKRVESLIEELGVLKEKDARVVYLAPGIALERGSLEARIIEANEQIESLQARLLNSENARERLEKQIYNLSHIPCGDNPEEDIKVQAAKEKAERDKRGEHDGEPM